MLITLIIGIAAGGIVSWLIAYFYYRKTNHDQNDLFNKLPEDIRKVLLEDQREKFSVKELNELINVKTIDTSKRGLSAFKACPKCGSKNIEKKFDVDVDADVGDDGEPVFSAWDRELIRCKDCGWEEYEKE